MLAGHLGAAPTRRRPLPDLLRPEVAADSILHASYVHL